MVTERERLRQLRESLAARRRTLSAARLVPAPPLDTLTAKETQELHALSTALARARSGLVQELVEVFHVVEVGGRPPIGGKAGTKGEWTIGDLILPVPGDIRRTCVLLNAFHPSSSRSNIRHGTGYPPDHINAVITHTIHFLGLLTFYLGVKLPFETEWSGKKLGVGHLWIGAGKGGESGSWAKYVLLFYFFFSCEVIFVVFYADRLSRWTMKHPLHLTASSLSSSPPSSPQTPLQTSVPPAVSTIASSTTLAPPTEPKATFTTAFAMLLYNVCYLAHTQSVEIPLSQAGDALGNLWAVCCSGELGRCVLFHRIFYLFISEQY